MQFPAASFGPGGDAIAIRGDRFGVSDASENVVCEAAFARDARNRSTKSARLSATSAAKVSVSREELLLGYEPATGLAWRLSFA